MAGQNNLSSEEKLLKVIRTGNIEPGVDDSGRLASSTRARSSPYHQGTTIGVDIGYNNLKLVKMGKKRQLMDFKAVAFPPDVTREDSRFPGFLRTTLAAFGARDADLWAGIPAAGLELRALRVPRVPKKQLANAVLWSFRKENPFNEKEMVFDFEVWGEVVDEGIKKIDTLAYTAPLKDVEELKNLFAKSGFPLSGVTAVPFAFQNLFRTDWFGTSKTNVCNLYIGRNWSRIDVFTKGNIVLSRGIKAGMNSMIEAIRDQYNEKIKEDEGGIVIAIEGEDLEPDQAPRKPIDLDQARNAFLEFIGQSTSPEDEKHSLPLAEDEIFEMIAPPLDRLIRQIERTLEHFTQKLRGEPVTHIYSTGPAAGSVRLLNHISQQLGVSVESIDPMGVGAPFAAPRAVSSPRNLAERASYAPAFGLALSNNSHTPNFIFIYKDKDALAADHRTRQLGLAIFSVIMVFLAGVYFWQMRVVSQKESEVGKLRKELESFQPQVTQDLITQTVATIKKNKETLDAYGRKYVGMAALSELTAKTPSHVRLLNVSTELSEKGPSGTSDPSKGSVKRLLSLEGLVSGKREEIEPALAQYLLQFQMSPLFGQPRIKEQVVRNFQGHESIFFTAEVEVR